MSNYQIWDDNSVKFLFNGLSMGLPYAVLAQKMGRTPASVQKAAQRLLPLKLIKGARRTYRQSIIGRRVINKQDHILGQYLFSETHNTEPLFHQDTQPRFLEVIQKAEAHAKLYKDTHAEIEDACTGEAYARYLGLHITQVPLDTSPTSYGYMLDRTLKTPGQILLKINMIREASDLMPLVVLEWLGEV